MVALISSVVLAGGAGALAGRFLGCGTGACPLLAGWKRGLLTGALIGLLLGLQQLA